MSKIDAKVDANVWLVFLGGSVQRGEQQQAASILLSSIIL
jgi:hypothetical protein